MPVAYTRGLCERSGLSRAPTQDVPGDFHLLRKTMQTPNRPSKFSAVLALTALSLAVLSPVSFAATVEFKLAPEVKGREHRALMSRLNDTLGAPSISAKGGNVFTAAAGSDLQAQSMVRALRENRSVMWAAVPIRETSEKALPAAEFHGRIMSLELRSGAAGKDVTARLSKATGQSIRFKRMTAGSRALIVLPANADAAMMAAIAVVAERDPSVVRASRVQMMTHQWLPNDTLWAEQWSLTAGVGGIRAPQAWDLTPSGNVQIAVIDTGIRSHPDLDGKRVPGFDLIKETFISADGDGRDADASDPGDADTEFECSSSYSFMSSWHGTHVAGIIAANTNNGQGIAGVAPNARIQSIRALGRCGGTWEDVADAIRWGAGVPVPGLPANPTPSKVLNLSLGGYGACDSNMQGAVDAAIARGTVVVVSAGNESSVASEFAPANCKGVLTVGASNLLGDLSSYSNFGAAVALSAPGGDFGNLPGVLSTLNGGVTLPSVQSYAVYSGTSMAAPHVAGVIALMLARDPNLTPGQVLNRLQSSVRSFPVGSDCAAAPGACGVGLLDAANAVASVAINRGVNDTSGSRDRVHAVELVNTTTGRFLLTADPVEVVRHIAGIGGQTWQRTGYVLSVYSFTTGGQSLAISQPVCRARFLNNGASRFSADTGECKEFETQSWMGVEGMSFAAALPGPICPVGSYAVHEMVSQDAIGYNIRTVGDTNIINEMLAAGWSQGRIAFCAPI
ncbi:MAG: hypothetical protein EAZ30_16940 [Betaproteobacteria bacterium]|nr:MAG: hypothetical protein EAZ30_16940 [Betaproteobacteria bacterium]